MHRKQAWAKRVRKERLKKKFLTRMQATRLLQTDSMGFRRLCILKGIYPRALGRSKQKSSGNDKQYYMAKEIKWLVRDHLQERIQDYSAWEKRFRRAKAMQKDKEIAFLTSSKGRPHYQLAATLKERYPYFLDALRDVDDAMTMISLYAFLSPDIHSESTIDFHKALPSGLHEKAKAVVSQWMDYVKRAKCLTRSFISIKGYYYEAVVKGERVRWQMPHEYASKFPSGVQQYILITFLEMYVELMRFVLFKLNGDLVKEIEEREAVEDGTHDANAETFAVGALEDKKAVSKKQALDRELGRVKNLFSGLTFYVSREVPNKHIHLIVGACGGNVTDTFNDAVTHFIIDRPALPIGFSVRDNVEYVQPQYPFDCMNSRILLPPIGYRMGESLPPHVSPFTVAISNYPEDIAAIEETKKYHPKIVSYVPDRVHEIRKLIDPSYVAVDPEGKVSKMDAELSDDEEHAVAPAMDDDDLVSLSGDELEEATRTVNWDEEEVTENVKRSKLSAFQVKKQREMNLMNKPTREDVAARRQERAKAIGEKKANETVDQRIKRKLAQKERDDKATRKMQLQVARKKQAKYYKMVNSVVQGNKKKEDMLATKAQQIKEGKTVPQGTTLVSKKNVDKRDKIREKVESRGEKYDTKKEGGKSTSNPYKKLPKWVQ